MIAERLGESVLENLRKRRPQLARKAEAAAQWLREASEPPPGVELRAADGSTYTGFVIVDRNEPVVMLAVRHPPGSTRPPVITPTMPPTPQHRSVHDTYGRAAYEPEEPLWDRNGDPYLR